MVITRLDVYETFAVMKGTGGKPKIKGRKRKTETSVQFLKRMVQDFPACTVYFKRNDGFEKVEKGVEAK